MAREEITHKGRLVEIGPTVAVVSFVASSACGACHAAGLCGASEMKDKRVEVPAFEAKGHAVGDEVEVALRASLGLKAVWMAYFLPLLVLLGIGCGRSGCRCGGLVLWGPVAGSRQDCPEI